MKYIFVLLFFFFIVLLLSAVYFSCVAQNTLDNSLASLHNIKSRLPSQAPKMQAAFPEGAFLSYIFYGSAWINLGLANSDPAIQQQAIDEATWTYRELGSHSLTNQFTQEGPLAHGVFYTGWRNRLAGGILLLQAEKNPELVNEFHLQSAILAKAFTEASQPILPSYPERVWPADNIPALASLKIHDKLYGTTYTADVLMPWISMVRQQYVVDTHLFPHQLNGKTGEVTKTARGASSAYLVSLFPEVNQELAAQQYQLYQSSFVRQMGPLSLTREYPNRGNKKRNTNSGPLINGFGATASVFNIAADRVNHNENQALNNSFFFSLIGLPIRYGQNRQYIFGKLLVYDAAITWSSSHINWLESSHAK